MSSTSERDDLLRGIFDTMQTVAVVGASHKPERPSYQIMQFLIDLGFDVKPVNPGLAGQKILGQTVFASLAEVDSEIDVVDIFRASDAALGVVREAVDVMDDKNIQVIWMQQGVVNADAVREAEAAGLIAVQDRCIMRDMKRLAS